MLILSWLCKRGVLKTDTPLLRNRLYFNILHFTLEIGSSAGTTKKVTKIYLLPEGLKKMINFES